MHFARQIITSFFIIAGLVATSAADNIQWAPDLETARRRAVDANKPLLIHFYTDSCPPCREVEKSVFPDPVVIQAINANYVPLKVNADKETALRDYFQVRSWPTDVIATADGRSLHSMNTPSQFMRGKPAPAQRYVQQLNMVAMAQRQAAPTQAQFASQQSNAGSHQNVSQQMSSSQQMANRQMPNQQQTAQRQLPDASRWANGVAAPQVTQSTAVAQRPGLSQSELPGVQFNSHAHNFAGAPGRQPNVMQQTQQLANVAQPQSNNVAQPGYRPYGQASAQNQAPPAQYAQQSAPRSAEMITNPYLQHSPVQTAPQQQLAQTPTQQPPPSQYRNVMQNTVPAQQSMVAAQQNAAIQQNVAVAQQSTVPPQQNTAATQQNISPRQAAVTQQQPAANTVAGRADVGPIQESSGGAPVGLDGRCPVTLVKDGKWKKGNAKWGAVHRGHTYLFSSAAAQKEFLDSPDRFSPVLAGMDIVRLADAGKVEQGSRQFGVLFDDDGADGPREARIYLFGSVESRNRFESSPDSFLQPVLQAVKQGSLDSLLRR